jgi:DNA helicase-2/ATP-dependent DNA helicase PcrA
MKENGIPPGRMGEWPGAGKKDGGLKDLSRLLSALSAKKIEPEKAAEKVMAYYEPILKEKFDDYPKRQRDLEQLVPMAGRYKSLRNFLDDLVLEPPSSSGEIRPENGRDALTLSTVHSAKGLEWPVVIIIWVFEGRFPSARAFHNSLDLEEERRLMYVAATRAKDELVMCYPGQESASPWAAYEMGGLGRRNGLSSFIRDLPDGVVNLESTGSGRRFQSPLRVHREKRAHPPRTESSTALSQGDRVNHPAFGPGVISRFLGDDKVEVLFRNVGRKLLHLEYTTLEKV